MCGRYAVVTKIKEIEKKFGVTSNSGLSFEPNANVAPGTFAPVITSASPKEIQFYRFGLMPSWSKKPMLLINARSEGDHNQDNLQNYTGAKGIFEKPSFRKPIRSQRCIIPADYFFEGPQDLGLSKPFCFYKKNEYTPFCFAGIWDEFIDQNSGYKLASFAIITTPANDLLRRIGHPRAPLILPEGREKEWLNPDLALSDISGFFLPPGNDELNAYPVSSEIKNPKAQGLHLLQPTGERVDKEYRYEVTQQLDLFGMGETRARKRKNNET